MERYTDEEETELDYAGFPEDRNGSHHSNVYDDEKFDENGEYSSEETDREEHNYKCDDLVEAPRYTSHSKTSLDEEMLRVMYSELQVVSAQLKTKNEELSQKEEALIIKEQLLNAREKEIQETLQYLHTNFSKAHGMTEKLKLLTDQANDYQDRLNEKSKELKRLKTSFDTVQETNIQLRKQLEQMHSTNQSLQKKCASLGSRLNNLQVCLEFKKENIPEVNSQRTKHKEDKADVKSVVKCSSTQLPLQEIYVDVFLTLINWTVSDVLKPSFEMGNLLDSSLRSHILENCQKIIPQLVGLLKDTLAQSRKLCLPFLQFVYWSYLLLEQNPGKQGVGLGGCHRRLAEELYSPLRCPDGSHLSTAFVKSSDSQIRMVSCLLLLHTLTQADHLANILNLLKQDMRDELCKELFVDFHGFSALLNLFKSTSKAHLPVVLDIYLLLSVESTILNRFLQSCSNEAWFRAVSMIIKIPSLDDKQLEKLSVILQKLSKIKENKKYFDMFAIGSSIQEMVKSLKSTDSSSFLQLNMKSVLYNLSSTSSVLC